MYTLDYYDLLEPVIEKNVIEDRMRHRYLYASIETYLSKYPAKSDKYILIGGSYATNLLSGLPRGVDEFYYEVFSEFAFFHANALTNILYSELGSPDDNRDTTEIDPRSVILQTTNASRLYGEYSISVNRKEIIRLRQCIKNFNEISISVTKPGYENQPVSVISPEMLLLDVYRMLYLPSESGDWSRYYEAEAKMYKLLRSRTRMIKKNIDDATGGDEIDVTGGDDNETSTTDLGKLMMEQFVANNPDLILIGDYAVQALFGISSPNPVLQIITRNNPFDAIRRIVELNIGGSGVLTSHPADVKIYCDHRLKKITIKYNNREFIQIFNSGSYDLIPFYRVDPSFPNNDRIDGVPPGHNRVDPGNPGITYQIGNELVLCRFILVDYYIIKYLNIYNILNDQFSGLRLRNLLDLLLTLCERIRSLPGYLPSAQPNKLEHLDAKKIYNANPDLYFGVLLSDTIYKKNQIKADMKLGKKNNNYQPSLYKDFYNKLRVITF